MIDRPYIEDAEKWGTQEEIEALLRTAGHTIQPTPEVIALHRIDRLIGNMSDLGPRTLGRVRGVVIDSLNDWHSFQRLQHLAEQRKNKNADIPLL